MSAGAVELDKELGKSLQVAKKKRRNFAIIAKGANVLKLMVDKKPIKEGPLQKAKKECQGTAIVKGVVGGDGPELVFQVLELPAIGEPKLKKFISDTTRLNVAPRFQVVQEIQEINDDLDDDAGAVAAAAAPPPAPPAAPEPPAEKIPSLPAEQLTAALNKLSPAIKQAMADHPSHKEQILRPVAAFQTQLKAGELAQARESLLQIGGVLKSLKDEAVEAVPGVQAQEKQVNQELARKQEAAGILAELGLIKDPGGAGKYQKRLDEKRQAVTEAVEQGEFQTARQGLVAVQTEVAQVTYEIARDALLKKYYAVADPPGATDAQLERLEKQRQLVLAQLPDTAENADLVEAEKQLKELGQVTLAVGQEVAARAEHLRRLAEAQQRLKASRYTFPIPPPNVIDQKFNLAKSAGQTASSVQDYTQANLLIDEMGQTLLAADDYTKRYDEVKGLVVMAGEKAPGPALKVFQDEAQQKAAGGDFEGALKELQKVKSDPSAADLLDYHLALREFWAAVSDKVKPKDDPLPQFTDGKDAPLTVAKAPALAKDPDYKEAATAVRKLLPKLGEMEPYRQRLFEVNRIKSNKNFYDLLAEGPKKKFEEVYGAALQKAKNLDYTGAKEKLDELNTETALPDLISYMDKLRAVESPYKAIQATAGGSAVAVHVQTLFEAAKLDATNEKYGDAAGKLDNLRPIVQAAQEYVDLNREIQDLCTGLDPLVVTSLLQPSVELAADKNYQGAVNLLKTLQGNVADMRAYFDRRTEVDKLRERLVSEMQLELDEVRKRAEELATAGNYTGGLAALNEIRQMPGLKDVDADLIQFQKELAVVTRAHAVTQKLLDQKELKEFLTQALSEAQAEAEPGGDLKEGSKKLAALAGILKEANGYAKERQMSMAMVDFLEAQKLEAEARKLGGKKLQEEIEKLEAKKLEVDKKKLEAKKLEAEAKKSGAKKPEPQELEAKKLEAKKLEAETKELDEKIKKLKAKKLEAEKEVIALSEEQLLQVTQLLGEGDEAGKNRLFPTALKKYQEVNALVKTVGEELAESLEQQEAGHCLSGHGPKTTLESQQARITTGFRPDNEHAPSAFACKFDKIEDFIATRQLATKMAIADPPFKDWNIKDVYLEKGKPNSKQYLIEHGRPIDTCVMGLKPKAVARQGGPHQGEAVEGDTYETHVTVSGLTRTRSTFFFKTERTKKALAKEMEENGKVEGKWMLNQQFPEADGWEPDETLKSGYYTTPLPGN